MAEFNVDKYLVAMQKGDQNALQTLYTLTKKGVFSFVYSYLKKYHDAEDAMQTVYLKIQNGINGYKKGTNAKAWILQIAKNHCLNLIKTRNRETLKDEIPETPDYGVNPLAGGITEIMQKNLTEEEYRIITLHVLWGYKHREIAKIEDCPTGTVTSKYKRALEKLRKILEEEK